MQQLSSEIEGTFRHEYGRAVAVLMVVYLIFNEGYSASSGDQLVRPDLCDEAIRLGRQLAELLPEESEVIGLPALMLFIDARRDARAVGGNFVKLADQDRDSWNQLHIEEGRYLLRICLERNRPGPYRAMFALLCLRSRLRFRSERTR